MYLSLPPPLPSFLSRLAKKMDLAKEKTWIGLPTLFALGGEAGEAERNMGAYFFFLFYPASCFAPPYVAWARILLHVRLSLLASFPCQGKNDGIGYEERAGGGREEEKGGRGV